MATARQLTPVEQAVIELRRLHKQFLSEKDSTNQKRTIEAFYQAVNDLKDVWPNWKQYLKLRTPTMDGILYPAFTTEGTLKCLELRFPEAMNTGQVQYWHLECHPEKVIKADLKQLLREKYHLDVTEDSSFEHDFVRLESIPDKIYKNEFLLAYPRVLMILMANLSNELSKMKDEDSRILVLDLGTHKNAVYLRRKSAREYRCLILDSVEAFKSQSNSHLSFSGEAHIFLMALQTALQNHQASANVYFFPGARQSSWIYCTEFTMHDIEVLLQKPMVANSGYQSQPALKVTAPVYSPVFDSVMTNYSGCALSVNGKPLGNELSDESEKQPDSYSKSQPMLM